MTRYKVLAQDGGTRPARRPHADTDRQTDIKGNDKQSQSDHPPSVCSATPLLCSDSVFVVDDSD